MERIKFKEFITLQRGFDLPKRERNEGEYPVVASTSITGWHDDYKVEPPGVTTGRSGSIGEVIYLDKKFWPLNTALWVKDFKGNMPRYVYYFLQTLNLEEYDSGASVPTLNRNHLDSIEIEVHSREEQKKIASILSAFDDLIENNSRRIEILEEMARRIYREWFVHFRYPGHEVDELVDSSTELGEIPEGWEAKTLESFGEIVLGKTPSTRDPENYGDYMPFIKTPDMHDQFFIHKTENVLSKKGVKTQANKTLPPSSICVSCIGTAGVVAITAVPSQTNQQINSIVPENTVDREYIYFATKALEPLMEKVGSTGATMTNVSKTKFKGLPALIPPRKILNDFHSKAGALFDQISTLQKQNINLKETRELLLPKLISGKINVKELVSN